MEIVSSRGNTLERSYTNHLRDALGYTGRVDASQLDRTGLQKAVALVESTQSEIEIQKTHRELAASCRKDHGERLTKYLGLLTQTRQYAPELIAKINSLPDHCDEADEADLQGLENLCKTLSRDVHRLNWAVNTSREIREQIDRHSKSESAQAPDLYGAVNGLLTQMGIAEPERLRALELQERTVNPDGLAKIKQSANYLLRKMGGP